MKRMVTVVFIIAVALSGILAISCVCPPPAQAHGLTTEERLARVYDRFYAGLILDGTQTHTVVVGDTLANLSRQYYDNGFYYPVIMLASREVVIDPDRIVPGMELTIPDLQRNLDNPRARANLKEFLLEIALIEDDRNRPQDAEGLRSLSASL